MTAAVFAPAHTDRRSPATPDCCSVRRVATVCSTTEAAQVQATLHQRISDPGRADLLWLTWVQWRAMGREEMVRETELSLWTVTCRLRQLRQAGVPIPSWTRELDLLARGQFETEWGA
ncbi:MAG: hypothetical protein JO250_23085 [Armatimonadetes bacterium]|nr:hypothetical protein [Armatimonadota bacterium]